eukprot:g12664.t1
MLISGPSPQSTTGAFGSSSNGCTPGNTALVWPGGAMSGTLQHQHAASDTTTTNSPFRRRSRARSSSSCPGGSHTALNAMAIPARCALPCVNLLRQAYGPRRNFWGDLSPAETRRFYHELLPVSVYLDALGSRDLVDGEERPLGGGTSGGGLATVVDVANQEVGHWECFFGSAETLEERARLASMARHAARMYVRERCHLPSRVVAHLYDGLRHLKEFGTFRVTGMTWEELWDKYEKKILAEDPALDGEALKTSVCLRILEKSCSTSEVFNNLSGCSELNTFLPDTTGVVVGSAGVSESGGPADPGKPTLAQARAAESAAACAGALRLIPLIKPFRRLPQQQKDDEASSVQKRAKRHSRQRRMVARRRRGRSRREANRQRRATTA